MAMPPEEQAKTSGHRHGRNARYESPSRFCKRSRRLCFVAPHVWPIDSKGRRESNSLGGEAAQHNANSSFDLAKSLAGAKNLAEVMELQGAYWRKQLDILMAQAEEVRTRRK
jgi:Phasin protein